jgi:hypothetical protein
MEKATSRSGEPKHSMRMGIIPMAAIIATKTIAIVRAVG